jgi:hypothetical protein
MTTRKAAASGWWVDERVPDLGGILPAGIDAAAFVEWLAPRVGKVRSAEKMRAAQAKPALAAELAAVQRTRRLLFGVHKALHGLPVHAVAHLSSAATRHREQIGEGWRDIAERIMRDSVILYGLLGIAEHALSATKVKRGNPGAIERDVLLNATVTKLREAPMTAKDALPVAEQVLVRCGIAVPEHKRALKRAVRRGRNTRKR